jgi:isoleucyl-tRNA synthetase
MVLLDAFAYPELAQEGLAREVLNRIQRLRKRAGLVPTDDVKVEYVVLPPTSTTANGDGEKADEAAGEVARLEQERVVGEMFVGQEGMFGKAASGGIVKGSVQQEGGVAEDGTVEEEAEVKEMRLLLRVVKI